MLNHAMKPFDTETFLLENNCSYNNKNKIKKNLKACYDQWCKHLPQIDPETSLFHLANERGRMGNWSWYNEI